MKYALLLLMLASVSPFGTLHQANAADAWPQWRGPHRDGHLDGQRLPAAWPGMAPAPLWQSQVGLGYSSPVVAGGRVFVMGRDDAERQELCLCFDARSGRELWRVSYGEQFVPPDASAGRGPSSTPTVDGDRVIMLGLGGMLHCLDAASGEVIWKHDCRREYGGVARDADGGDAWFPPCGCATSAIVDGAEVIVSVGGQKAGAFAGFDRKTGELRWSALDDRGSYGSPVITTLAGVRQLIGFTGKRMVGLDARTHELLWEHPFEAEFEQTAITPVVWRDLVIFGGEKRPLLAVRVTREGETFTPEVAWKSVELRPYITTPVVFGDQLIGLDERRGRLVRIDLESGKTFWAGEPLANYATLLIGGDQLLALANDGVLHTYRIAPQSIDQQAEWTVSDVGATISHAAVADGRLYIKDKERLICFELGG